MAYQGKKLINDPNGIFLSRVHFLGFLLLFSCFLNSLKYLECGTLFTLIFSDIIQWWFVFIGISSIIRLFSEVSVHMMDFHLYFGGYCLIFDINRIKLFIFIFIFMWFYRAKAPFVGEISIVYFVSVLFSVWAILAFSVNWFVLSL